MMGTTDEQVSFIKWNTELELIDLLNGYKKNELINVADEQGVTLKKSWNKAKMVDVLAEKTTEQAETIYHDLLASVLTRLPDLDTHIYRVNELADIQGFIPLIQKGFFFVTQEGVHDETNEERGIFLLIPEEILFSVKDRLTETPQTVSNNVVPTSKVDETKQVELLNQWQDKALAIYGTVSLEHLQTTWNRYFDEKLTVKDIQALLD